MYGLKLILRNESVRDHADILLSMKKFPIVVISDLSSMLALHIEKRRPGTFAPNLGRLAEPTEDKISACKNGTFSASIPSLDQVDFPENAPRFSLADKFHEKNLSAEQDLLRRTGYVKQLAGKVNTQVQEQLFRQLGRNAYFITQMNAHHYLFFSRLIMHLHNVDVNARQSSGIAKSVQDSGRRHMMPLLGPGVSCPFIVLNQFCK
jgi:hypothetical protein